MGMYGATVTVLPQEPVHNRVETAREASPNVNLDEIPTPSTPRSCSSCSARWRLVQELDRESIAAATSSSSISAMEEDEEEGNGATQPGAITASALAEVDARVDGHLSGVIFLGDFFQMPPVPSAKEDSSSNALDTAEYRESISDDTAPDTSYEEGSARSTVLSDGDHAEDAPMPALVEVFEALGAAEEVRLQG